LAYFPGCGVTQRLRRLTGLSNALELILGGKLFNGKKAEKLGIVDACVPVGYLEFKEKSFVDMVLNHPNTILSMRNRGSMMDRYFPSVVFSYARKNVMAKTKGKYPAAIAILDLFEKTQNKEVPEGLELEGRAFSKLAVTDISKNLIGLFYASESLKKETGVKRKVNPLPINMINVIGAGVMGSGIVFQFSKIDKAGTFETTPI